MYVLDRIELLGIYSHTMDNQIQDILVNSVLRILRPLVKVLLRNGMAYGSFSELAKRAFVDVAFADYTPDGKKQTISRVSALTGLTRKEVKRLVESPLVDTSQSEQRYNRATRVVSGWINDKRFSNEAGGEVLYLDERKPSFNELVKDYSGDVPPKAMLSTLQSAGTVKVENDQVVLIRHAYIPGDDAVEKLNILGTDVAELVDTINHNLVHEDDLRFQRKASNLEIKIDDVPEFRKLMAKKSQHLLEEFDTWLSEHATEEENESSRYISVGIYYHEADPSDGGTDDNE